MAVLAVLGACQVQQRAARVSAPSAAPWSDEVAVSVLKRAVNAEDGALRAQAWDLWLASGHPSSDPVLARAVMDPSPMVQRALAKAHAGRIGAELAKRSSLDPVAAAWLVLHGYSLASPESDFWAVLYPALAGETAAQGALLDRMQDGVDVLEPGLVEVLGASGIDGMAAALVLAAQGAEPMLASELQLAALGLGDVQAAEQLLSVDTPLEVGVWAIEVAVRQPSPAATDRLKRLARATDHPLQLHAQIGLMALRGGPKDLFAEGLRHPDKDTRAWAAACMRSRTLDRSALREEIALLQGSTRDESTPVRVESVKTLVEIVGIESVPLRPPSTRQELNHVDLIVAAEWLARGRASRSR